MRIFLDVEVHCADGPCGRLTRVILDPWREKVMYGVIQQDRKLPVRWLLPLSPIVIGTPNKLVLRCIKETISSFEPWDGKATATPRDRDLDFIALWTFRKQAEVQGAALGGGTPESDMLILGQDVEIQAADGYVGYLAGFEVDPATGAITHLIVHRERKVQTVDITIPAHEIQRIQKDVIYLISYRSILDALPSTRARRRPRHHLSG
ncbi:MAG: hypothetical protein JXA33_10090 [Anaerolineae bacterium]|nr:hypothetical protein [Anaerolineae bacterium]